MTKVNINAEPQAPQKRKPQERVLRTRAALMDSARRIVAEKGYAGLRAEAVAQAAGVAKGTVFSHFPDMDHLIAALVAEDLARLPPCRSAPQGGVAQFLADLDPLFDFMASDTRIIAALARFSGPEGAGLGVEAALCARGEDIARCLARLVPVGSGANDPGLLAEGVMAFVFHTAASALCAEGEGRKAQRQRMHELVRRWVGPVSES